MKQVLVINGPNINMLGKRESDIYGSTGYEELIAGLKVKASKLGIGLDVYQSNHEGEIVDKIQSASGKYGVIIINAGAYTHTSVAIRDAILAVDVPAIETHISNIHKREDFRQKSYLSDIVKGVIAGFGIYSYHLALEAAAEMMDTQGK